MNKQRIFFWMTLLRVILFWSATMAIFAIASGIVKQSTQLYSSMIAVGMAIIGTLLLTILFARWQKMNLQNTYVVPGKRTAPNFMIGFLIGTILAVLQPLAILATGHVQIVVNNEIATNSIVSVVVFYFLLASREELVFRGFPLRSLEIAGGSLLALVITGIIFIIEHIIGGMNWWPATWGTGTGALLFGVAALTSRGLALPIGLHFAWNVIQWTLGLKNQEGPFRAIVDKGHENNVEIIGSISYMFVMGIAIAGFLYYRRLANRRLRATETGA